jgi:hypothetical protein
MVWSVNPKQFGPRIKFEIELVVPVRSIIFGSAQCLGDFRTTMTDWGKKLSLVITVINLVFANV